MILSQNNLTPEINAIREKGMNEFQRIKQEISQGNITKGKPGPNNPTNHDLKLLDNWILIKHKYFRGCHPEAKP